MTDKQIMYFDLLRHGYSLEEIAHMTRRSVNTVRATLAKAADKDCMSPENCRGCALMVDCECIKQLVASAPRRKVYHRREPGGGRYSY